MNSDLRLNDSTSGAKLEPIYSRATSRIRLQVPVFLRGSDAAGVDFIELTRTLNISSRGACITCSHHLRVDQVVHLTIPAPAPFSSSMVPSETPPITAKVRRQQDFGDLRVFGLEFLRPLE
jgi:hypothetical protein